VVRTCRVLRALVLSVAITGTSYVRLLVRRPQNLRTEFEPVAMYRAGQPPDGGTNARQWTSAIKVDTELHASENSVNPCSPIP
jgi:hypothetical protein